MGKRASVPESLLVFCNSASWSSTGDHASLDLLVSARGLIDKVPRVSIQEISAPFLDIARLFKFFCKCLPCTVYIRTL